MLWLSSYFMSSTNGTNFHPIPCSAITCDLHPVMANSRYHLTSGSYGDTYNIYCIHGYWFSRNVTSMEVKCGSTGMWEPMLSEGCKGEVGFHTIRDLPNTNTYMFTEVNVGFYQ